MKIAFLTEGHMHGKYSPDFPNARTEIAWMIALKAEHFYIGNFDKVKNYDYVFVIPPKGGTYLSSDGIELVHKPNRFSALFAGPLVQALKNNNKKVAFIQEGPVWYVNDFDVIDQFNFYNQVSECDMLFAHNEIDKKWYQGLYPDKPVHVMPTLLIEELIQHISPNPENKVIIGGNFSRWYGGFQSYLVASELDRPIFVPSMHCKRKNEDQVPNLTHLPYLTWIEWMKTLSTFSVGVHMMPTVAAGTFSLNCAYFGIPCIGNIDVDTQRLCFPDLSFRAEDVKGARAAAQLLKNDPEECAVIGRKAKRLYREEFGIATYKSKLQKLLQ